jgi:uncharacterized membrane protein
MHHREFFKLIDETSVIAAIHRAEQKSSAQVRVFVSHHHVAHPMDAARTQFRLLGMEKTRERNAVLIYIAPQSRKFAIFGDVAVDEKCGAHFWEAVRDETVEHLKAGRLTAGVIHAVDRVGETLAAHFPLHGEPVNELPDTIARD